MQDLKKPLRRLNDKKLKVDALNYITAGVGCNCLVTLFETGLLSELISKGYIHKSEIDSYGEVLCITSALVTLEKSGVFKIEGEEFYITEFGRALSDYLGLITIFFSGYGNLIAQQSKIAQRQIRNKQKLIKGKSVAKAAVLIAEKMIIPEMLREMIAMNVTGTICDLGCGYADMLSKICQATGNPGLGFDSESKVVEEAAKIFDGRSIAVEYGDIANLKGVWEDVTILVQCHVLHDFTPNKVCVDIVNSYLDNFPNLKSFFYVDTVTPSAISDELFPGFDYVHGLLGIPTRNYEETIEMFSQSLYEVVKEIRLKDLPNTFLWILMPKKKEVGY